MSKQTAMQQLLTQMREERNKLPIPIEWGRCYQAIEMMIHHTYIPMEREQIIEAANNGCKGMCMIDTSRDGKNYYNETYGGHSVDANEMIDHNGDVNEMVGGQDE